MRFAPAALRERGKQAIRFLARLLRPATATFREDWQVEACVNLCMQCLGHASSPEQLEYYATLLRKGVPISRLVEAIEASPEGRRHQIELEEEQRAFVELAYQQCLGRAADAAGLQYHIKLLSGGMARSRVLTTLQASPEAQAYERQRADERCFCIDALHRLSLGRGATADEIQRYGDALRSGVSFPRILHEVSSSVGAEDHKRQVEEERAFFINAVFQQYLGRMVDPDALRLYQHALAAGMRLRQILDYVQNSPERQQYDQRNSPLLDRLSDGEFVLALMRLLGHGCTPSQLEEWRNLIREDPKKRIEFLGNVIESRIAEDRSKSVRNSHAGQVMGTNFPLNPSTWHRRTSKVDLTEVGRPTYKPIKTRTHFTHSGTYVVSAITSLYKGRRYLETFLDNIVSQSIFDRSELIVIDANSPEGEEDVIRQYQEVYPNIVYKRLNHRISIYEAWNLGVEIARGAYLTNANLDDLRRRDSFELQAATLDRYNFADVVYQPVIYSLDSSLTFEEVAAIGIKSILPIMTRGNILEGNWPHNAPMWRKALHDELGLFDTSFASAGDWEFWIRCASSGKTFFKINEPHVLYFQNPDGISTRPDTKGIEEARKIRQEYCDKLISPYLLMSRRAFARVVGADPNWDWSTPYFRVVHGQLTALGARFKGEATDI